MAATKYIEQFFDQANDADKIVRLVERKCL
jgi:hypothetical protein